MDIGRIKKKFQKNNNANLDSPDESKTEFIVDNWDASESPDHNNQNLSGNKRKCWGRGKDRGDAQKKKKNASAQDKEAENPAKNLDELELRYRLKKFYRVMHILFFILGLGLIITGTIIAWIESKMMGNLGLNLTDLPKKLYLGTGGAVMVMSILGQLFANFRKLKMLTWLLYLFVLCSGACSTAGCSLLSLRSYKNHNFPRVKLFELMNLYNGKTGGATEKWDDLHQGYKCCGVDVFTDWTESPFGRTSLRTPMSCCRNYKTVKDKSCGQNLLPDTDFKVADEIVFAKGCIKEIMRDTDVWYLGSGLYSGLVTLLISVHLLFCFFLLTSRRL